MNFENPIFFGIAVMDITKTIAVLGAIAAMIYTIRLIFMRLEKMEQGFGPNTTKVIGMALFLPILFMLTLLTNFQIETIAALLGTIAGYVLSQSRADDKQ